MRYSTHISPPPNHPCLYRPRLKNWPRPPSHLTTRSSPRTRPHYRTNFVNLTKTCSPRPSFTASTHKLLTTYHFRPNLHPCRRMRRLKPNPVTKNFSLLLHRPPRMNSINPPIRPLSNPFNPNHLSNNDTLNIPHL